MKLRIKDVQKQFLDRLGSTFEREGFSFRKTNFEFVKRQKNVVFIFDVGIIARTGWYSINPAVFCGSPQINKIFNKALSRKIPANSFTCGFGIGNRFDQKRGFYCVDSIDSLTVAIESVKKDFKEVALPWFDEVDSIESIDRFMNFAQEGSYRPQSASSASKGLIAAKLAGNPKYNTIFNDYYKFCLGTQGEDAAESIAATKRFLDEL